MYWESLLKTVVSRPANGLHCLLMPFAIVSIHQKGHCKSYQCRVVLHNQSLFEEKSMHFCNHALWELVELG